MGLDMYLYRFPRYKGYGAKDVMAINDYLDWLESDDGKKYSLEEWCGVKEEDIPKGEDLEYFKGLRKVTYCDWDTEHRWPEVKSYENVAYWRKANAVHKWFVEAVQGGEDDCDFHDEVTRGVLERLRDICAKVIESAVLVQGKIQNGYSVRGGKLEPIMVDGKYILDASVCDELLPTGSGYFFGGTDYDEYYLGDVNDTFDICNRLLEETDFENQMIYYRSSW